MLASIGIETVLEIPAGDIPAMHGFGWAARKPYLWLVDGGTVGSNMHLAFTVEDRAAVETFHAAALAGGAAEIVAPAVHPAYHSDYSGGFVRDPHGLNLEAVCHRPATARA